MCGWGEKEGSVIGPECTVWVSPQSSLHCPLELTILLEREVQKSVRVNSGIQSRCVWPSALSDIGVMSLHHWKTERSLRWQHGTGNTAGLELQGLTLLMQDEDIEMESMPEPVHKRFLTTTNSKPKLKMLRYSTNPIRTRWWKRQSMH